MAAIMVLFSAVSYGELTGDKTTKAYAATIKQEEKLQQNPNLVAVEDLDAVTGNAEKKLSQHGKKPALCAVGNIDFNFLKEQYGANIITLDVNGMAVKVVQINQSSLSPGKLKKLVALLGNGKHCHIVHHGNSLFYLLFRSEIS
jgi:hypothetical protein